MPPWPPTSAAYVYMWSSIGIENSIVHHTVNHQALSFSFYECGLGGGIVGPKQKSLLGLVSRTRGSKY